MKQAFIHGTRLFFSQCFFFNIFKRSHEMILIATLKMFVEWLDSMPRCNIVVLKIMILLELFLKLKSKVMSCGDFICHKKSRCKNILFICMNNIVKYI